jgi:hypothetical protein
MKTDNFKSWIIKQRLDLLIAIIPIIPTLIQFAIPLKSLNWFIYIANLLLISCTIFYIIRHNITIDDSEKNELQLSQYVVSQFESDWVFFRNGADVFFRRMNISIKQFYYSLIIVWSIWLILYVEKIIHLAFKMPLVNDNIFEDIMNLANSIAIFFMYMVITIPTVKINKFPSEYNKRTEMIAGMIIIIFLGTCCICVEQYSILSANVVVEKYVREIIAMIACVSFMAFLGRLNTSFLNIPQSIIMVLYLYAGSQLIYPMMEDNKYFYLFALMGKIFFYLVIMWILQKDRFLFFLINKAHAMSEANDMLKSFHRIYGKEIEKDDMI